MDGSSFIAGYLLGRRATDEGGTEHPHAASTVPVKYGLAVCSAIVVVTIVLGLVLWRVDDAVTWLRIAVISGAAVIVGLHLAESVGDRGPRLHGATENEFVELADGSASDFTEEFP